MPRMSGAEGQSRTDTELPPPVFELVAVRTTRPHQPFYVPQSRLQCSNAFHQTAGDINPLYDVLYDGLTAVSRGGTDSVTSTVVTGVGIHPWQAANICVPTTLMPVR